MTFELTQEQKDIFKAAKDWAEGKFETEYDDDKIREYDKEEKFPNELFEEALEMGFIGTWIPEKYGGPGLGFLESALVTEALSTVDPFFGILWSGLLGSDALFHFGTEEQKEKYLTEIIEDKAQWAIAFTEPDSGTDVGGIKTKARKEGDEWIINGTKQFNTNATNADYDIILCITNPEMHEENRYMGMSQIIVDTDQEGFIASDLDKMGMGYMPTGEVRLEDVRVPEENMLGEKDMGFIQAMQWFDQSRVGVAAGALGIAQCALNIAVDYIKEREAFGKKLSEIQDPQFRIAEMEKEIQLSRSQIYRAGSMLDNKDPDDWDSIISAVAKWQAGSTASKVVKEALLLHGGYGYTKDFRIERLYRDVGLQEIVEGTKEAEKMVISRELLKRH